VTTEVAFEYIDLGGTENLAVNGSVVQIGDMPSFHGLNLGGVTVSVLTIPIPGGRYGKVTLTGDVQTLQVGGQEFFMDDLCIEGRPLAPCDRVVDHQSRTVGEIWGASFGDTPGDLIFIENGIPVYIDRYLADNGGWFYNYCVIDNPLLGFGIGNVMQISNVVNRYDIGSTGVLASKVTFDYLDLGGKENLEVNNAPRYVGEMDMAPAVIAPGVTCSVTTTPVPGGVRGTVTLTGPVDKLTVGGQEFWIDTICVTDNANTVNWCNHLSDIESPALGSTWGGSVGSTPGDLMFVEDGMTAHITEYTDPTGVVLFGDARVDNAFPPFGSGQVLTLNNVNVRYGLSVLGVTEKVRIEYFDGAGMENFQVNGAAWYYGEIDAAPSAIAPGVTCTVYENAGPGFDYGVIVLEGDVDTFFLGGQQFAVDNVCVRINGSTTDVAAVPAAVSLEPNVPNPFNPSTTLRYTLGVDGPVRLTVHDAAGRVIRTLVNEVRAAGPNQVVWDGRDERGTEAAAGVYFVRVESRQGV
ncbi:hypothetical protein KDK88_01705, partial [bacterium]|nr:hypothetical protein [bacterium]